MNINQEIKRMPLFRIFIRILLIYLLSSLIVIYIHDHFLHELDQNIWVLGKLIEIGMQLIVAMPLIFLYVVKYKRSNEKIGMFQTELDNKDEQFRYLIESLPDAIIIYSKDTILFVNEACVQMMGSTDKESLLRVPPYQLLYQNRDDQNNFDDEQLLFSPSNGILVHRIVRGDGSSIDLEYVKIIVTFNGEKAILIIGRDISERNKINKELATASSLLNNIVNSLDAAIYSVDVTDNTFIFTSDAYRRDLGIPEDVEVTQDYWREKVLPEDLVKLDELTESLMVGIPIFANARQYKEDGSIGVYQCRIVPVKDAEGRVIRIDGVNVEVTEIISAHERIEFLAYHDDLTGLANRRLYHKYLKESVQKAKLAQSKFAIMHLDLDKFKNINDSLGNYAGDAFLKEVARRLSSIMLGETDTVARMGGDEFTVIYHYNENSDLHDKITEIQNILNFPFLHDGYEFMITTSIGITVFPDDGTEIDLLSNFADNAMFQAKQSRNGFRFHNRDILDNNLEKINIQNELSKAIAKQEFSIVYQPKHHLSDQRLIGAEALIRWKHPELGQIPPDKFIPIAEEAGLIHSIGEWVLIQVCEQIHIWESHGYRIPVSVNLSVQQFRDVKIVDSIQGIIIRSGIDPCLLELEITESMAMDIQKALPILNALSEIGVLISIDDFGTGYSSLSYLKNLPVHQLKIDKSFVDDIMRDAAIISTVVALAHNLNMKVIAEGVETAEQAARLLAMQCDEAQGYYFHKPLSLEEFNRLLLSRASDEVLISKHIAVN
jgi:diguanylate cyclase (GGDEF)-like protein/PAS domain S-box-containing protein